MSQYFDPMHDAEGELGRSPSATVGRGQGTDSLPPPTFWIHDLIQAEVSGDEQGANSALTVDPYELMDESAVQFLGEIRDHLSEYVRAFNAFSEQGKRYAEVKLYQVAQTASDFMLFRSQLKLVFALAAHGVIRIGIENYRNPATHRAEGLMSGGAGAYATVSPHTAATQRPTPGMKGASLASPQEILAQLGPFRDVYWMFQGERVQPEQLAKYYFQEFVRVSRQPAEHRAGSQQLLKQLRALLRESSGKGL